MKKLVSLVLAILMCCTTFCALADEAIVPAFATVTGGDIMGYEDNGTYVFKGIYYGTAERFEEAVPAKWDSLDSCLVFAEASPQDRTLAATYNVNNAEYITPSGTDMVGNEEKCLNLNVWTKSMEASAKKPVMVFMHGGGLNNGAAHELVYYDGQDFVEANDCVFVSVNARLNYLGYLDVSAYGGEEVKNSGNLGLTDMVLSLEWVRDNIATFGGDPENVTIVGQSGGGRKVTSLACLPAAEGLFDRVVILSGGYDASTTEAQQAETAKLVEYLGLTESDDILGALKALSYEELYAACQAAGVSVSVQVDGDYYPAPWYDAATGKMNEYAAKRSYIVSSVFAEMQGGFARYLVDGYPVDLNYYTKTEEWTAEQYEKMFGDRTEAVLAAFREAFPTHDDVDVLSYVNRASRMMQATACVTNGVTVYNCLVAYEEPYMGGQLMHHTGDIPYWFDSIDKVAYMIKGDEDNAHKVEKAMSQALAAFVKTGNPSTESLTWTEYTAENPVTMVFDAECYEKANLDTELLQLMYSK